MKDSARTIQRDLRQDDLILLFFAGLCLQYGFAAGPECTCLEGVGCLPGDGGARLRLGNIVR
jgi:hypothetical protein